MNDNKPENSEKVGDENYEMFKYLMENVFKKPEKEPEKEPEKTQGNA